MEETEHGFAIHDIDTDNEDRIGYVELTGDSAYDEQDRFPLAIEIVRRWNTFPEAIDRIHDLIETAKEVENMMDGDKDKQEAWTEELGRLYVAIDEARDLLQTLKQSLIP